MHECTRPLCSKCQSESRLKTLIHMGFVAYLGVSTSICF